ncbi:MAG: hypothetical protein Q9171_000605 [Xanthocarpia ochracea]
MLLQKEPSLEYILPNLTTIPLPSPLEHPSSPPSLSTIPPELYAFILPHLRYIDKAESLMARRPPFSRSSMPAEEMHHEDRLALLSRGGEGADGEEEKARRVQRRRL